MSPLNAIQGWHQVVLAKCCVEVVQWCQRTTKSQGSSSDLHSRPGALPPNHKICHPLSAASTDGNIYLLTLPSSPTQSQDFQKLKNLFFFFFLQWQNIKWLKMKQVRRDKPALREWGGDGGGRASCVRWPSFRDSVSSIQQVQNLASR